MMRRRDVIALLGGAAATWPHVWPHAAWAQQANKIRNVAWLGVGSADQPSPYLESLRAGLRELGWVEGRNIAFEWRFAEGRNERLPGLAAGLVRDDVDLIVAQPASAVLAAKKATSTVPIVMAAVTDPIGLGLVASLSRPGGNVTGLAYSVDLDIFAKQLQLLKDAVPTARRVAVFYNAANPTAMHAFGTFDSAARSMGIALHYVEVRTPADFEGAFATIARGRADAVLVMGDPLFGLHAARLAELSTKRRLPTMHAVRANVDAGGLIMYGPNIVFMIRQTAAYVDRILKGASPSALAVEHPTRFMLVVNQKTARALGVTIPPAVLLRADQVIE